MVDIDDVTVAQDLKQTIISTDPSKFTRKEAERILRPPAKDLELSLLVWDGSEFQVAVSFMEYKESVTLLSTPDKRKAEAKYEEALQAINSGRYEVILYDDGKVGFNLTNK